MTALSRPLRVVIVDADRRVRHSLSGLLGLDDDVLVVGTASDVHEALAVCAELEPDVVVVDPRLPEVDAGLALVERLRKRSPAVRVVAVCSTNALENPSLDRGAVAFVPKGESPVDFVRAILAAGAPASS